MPFTYKYPRPAVTVDCLIIRHNPKIEVLLIERRNPPFQNHWALPGGFVDLHETIERAAIRELEEETGIKNISLKQLYSFGDPERDPRGYTVTIVFWGEAPQNTIIKAGDDANNVKWFSLNQLPKLAFDHEKIIKFAIENLNKESTLKEGGINFNP